LIVFFVIDYDYQMINLRTNAGKMSFRQERVGVWVTTWLVEMKFGDKLTDFYCF